MSFEILSNNPTTTLSADITSVATTLVVMSNTGFPGTGNFRIRIDNEIILVTSISGTTWTIQRAVESYQGIQLALAHLNGSVITGVLTQDAANKFVAQETGGITISGLGSPTNLTIANIGTAGLKTYTYKITAVSVNGGETNVSSSITTNTGATTLTGSNFNRLNWLLVPRAVSYNIYRTSTNGTPSSTGKIGSVLVTSSLPTQFDDTGLTASGTVPSTDTSFFSGINTVAPVNAWDIAGSCTITVGLNVGFVSTPSQSRINFGDANFNLDGSKLVSASQAIINFDSDTNITYVRSAKALFCTIGGTFVFSLDVTGAFGATGIFNLGTGITSTTGGALVLYVGNGTTAATSNVFMRIETTTFKLYGHTTGADVLWATINSSAGWSAASTSEIKDSIEDVTSSEADNLCQDFLNLALKSYFRKDDLEHKKEYGIIADDAMPEIVGDRTFKTVNSTRWLGVLTVIVQTMLKELMESNNEQITKRNKLNLSITAGMGLTVEKIT